MAVTHVTGGNQLLDARMLLERMHVHEGTVFADLGCGGVGHYVFPASAFVGRTGRVYAVDILKSVLQGIERRIREENIRNMTTVWTDLEVVGGAKAMKDGSVDVALFSNTLFQSKNHEAMMREAARMLKKGGTLMIVEWTMNDAPLGPPKEMRVPRERMREIAQRIGFDEVESFSPGEYHYAIIFKKTR